jgi:hypothetical protein
MRCDARVNDGNRARGDGVPLHIVDAASERARTPSSECVKQRTSSRSLATVDTTERANEAVERVSEAAHDR